MTIVAVATNVGAVAFGLSSGPGELAPDLRAARQIDKDARQAPGIEIRRDGVPVARFLHRCAICQNVKTGETVDLKASVHTIRLGRGLLQSTRRAKKQRCVAG